jgi:hypothetical protein
LLPFICDGLNCGQRAYHVLPSKYREEHLQQLRDAGIDVEAAQRSRQLELALPEHTYLRSGRFDKEAMLAVIQEALRAGTSLGFPLTRMIAHAETAVDDWSSANEWVEYEMRLNDVLPRYDDRDLHIRRQLAERQPRARHLADASRGDHRRRAGGEFVFFQPGGLSARDS